MNVMRAFNIREGFTKEDDCIPERFYQPLRSCPLEGETRQSRFRKIERHLVQDDGLERRGNPQFGEVAGTGNRLDSKLALSEKFLLLQEGLFP